MFLLDTNVISELRRKNQFDANVYAWSQAVPLESLYVSVVTVMEIEQGILLVGRRDHRQAGALRSWMTEQFLPRFAERVLAFDTVAALRCAAIHVPDPKPDRDSMIAATASVHGLTVATRNVRDFEACGVPVFNPWLYASP